MKRTLSLALLLLLLLPISLSGSVQFTASPHTLNTVASDHTNITQYSENFASVGDWSHDSTGELTTDGTTGTFEFWQHGTTFYTVLSSTMNLYGATYSFEVSTEDNLDIGYFGFYDGSSYQTIQTFTATGNYSGTIEVSGAEAATRISIILDHGIDFNPTPMSPASIEMESITIKLEGIYDFAQTIGGDVLHYPDAFNYTAIANDFDYDGVLETDHDLLSYTYDDDLLSDLNCYKVGNPYIEFCFFVPSGDVSAFDYKFNVAGGGIADYADLQICVSRLLFEL